MTSHTRSTPETLAALPIVVRVAETHSFSEAARQLGLTPSGVSKAISRLEGRLGVRLFDRTTRHVAPTEDGARFYERCRHIVADLEEAQTELIEARSEPRGTLLVTMPSELGRRVAPALPTFLSAHPRVSVRLELTDRRVDLVGERIDVALRMGADRANSHGRLLRTPVGQTRAVVVASPAYLREHTAPTRPEDLASHRACLFGSLHGDSIASWRLQRDTVCEVRPQAQITVDSGTALVDLALQGQGLVAVFDFLVADALQQGTLVRVLPEWDLWEPVGVEIVVPRTRRASLKIQRFSDFLRETVATLLSP